MSANIRNFLVPSWPADVEPAPVARSFEGQQVRVVLADFERELLAWLAPFEAVVGCVAWLSNASVVDALCAKPIAQVVVQKEHWLLDTYSGRRLTEAPNAGVTLGRSLAPPGVSAERFRVFGFNGPGRERPFMHHKFFVGCSGRQGADGYDLVAESVWAGSVNWSGGGYKNLDSALVLGPGPAAVYLAEWQDVFLHSEPLAGFADGPRAAFPNRAT